MWEGEKRRKANRTGQYPGAALCRLKGHREVLLLTNPEKVIQKCFVERVTLRGAVISGGQVQPALREPVGSSFSCFLVLPLCWGPSAQHCLVHSGQSPESDGRGKSVGKAS